MSYRNYVYVLKKLQGTTRPFFQAVHKSLWLPPFASCFLLQLSVPIMPHVYLVAAKGLLPNIVASPWNQKLFRANIFASPCFLFPHFQGSCTCLPFPGENQQLTAAVWTDGLRFPFISFFSVGMKQEYTKNILSLQLVGEIERVKTCV